jgi:ethanolamine ammonia-lyase small subunit
MDNSDNPWDRLRAWTPARIGLERCGDGLSTQALLKLQLDHAHARDAVQKTVDFVALASRLEGLLSFRIRSAALDRAMYLRRPDLGRQLDQQSRALLSAQRAVSGSDVVFVVADGLSSAAVQDHACPTLIACLERLRDWRIAPIVFAEQARVALGDEIRTLLNCDLCVVLIGERPGLSVANSLGIYLTWQANVGHRDADRNCVSNIHEDGLSYAEAADKVAWLLSEARRLRYTGTALKDNPTSRLEWQASLK